MKDREDRQYEVSSSNVALRTVAFVLALVLAVGAFSFGISRLGYKEPGYYEIEVPNVEDASFYRVGYTLTYRFDGESNQIKAEMNTLKDVYADALLRSYKLLDANVTYEGYANLATLNQSLGQMVEVSDTLFDILANGWDRTGKQEGYNLFGGVLRSEWNSILAQEDMSEFDPAVYPDVAQRLQELAARTGELSNFSLELNAETKTVKVCVSDSYLDFLAAQEFEGAILDTGALTDAYRLGLIRDALAERGFTNGYLSTESGLTVSLASHDAGSFVLYGMQDDGVGCAATLPAGADSVCSMLRTFPMQEGEVLYHIADGRFYHPNLACDGTVKNVLVSSCVTGTDGDIVEAAYRNLCLYSLSTPEEVLRQAHNAALILRQEPSVVYSDLASVVKTGEGYSRNS